MKIKTVDPDSPLFGLVRPGYAVVSINGKPVLDSIDFRFKTADERVKIKFADSKGREIELRLDERCPGDLGLTLDDGRVMVCKNNCIFCFVHQQPKGMRRTLYVKDEDYRLSFTHGNFVTFTNTSDEEIKRIIKQRLSPLYVSVHATDDELRSRLLGNRNILPILPLLRRLVKGGITIHTQCVLCPGINDGENLKRTIDELSSLYPGVASLAVVPVGLTKYRERLPKLRKYSREEAAEIVRYIERRQKEFTKSLGSRFVWAADEFYVETGRDFPKHAAYEDMPQFENGVGMAREFITVFNRRRPRLRGLKSRVRALMLTGYSAYPFLNTQTLPYIREKLKLKLALEPVRNDFWGDTVTVSGLLTGADLLKAASGKKDGYDMAVLPPNCLNEDKLFLDDMSLEQFEQKLGRKVVVGSYDLAETLREVFV
ncbi:MAG: DUF512 domain-containing protein [Candidatus Zixiibacteriota bacterium]